MGVFGKMTEYFGHAFMNSGIHRLTRLVICNIGSDLKCILGIVNHIIGHIYYWFLLLKNTVIHLKQKIIIHNITNLAK